MRSRLIFVHGVGGPRNETVELRRWLVALATGAMRAGHSRTAATLQTGHQVNASFVCYGDLFMTAQAQGAGGLDLDDEQAAILADIMRGLVDAQLAGHWGERDRRILEHARAQADAESQGQGAGNLVRQALNVATTLMSLGPMRRAGQWATSRLLLGDLAQVARYLARGEADADGLTIDQRIRARLTAALGGGPTVVVAHSLGTVVALESLHERSSQVPLFVTLGSPISMRTVVWPRLVPQPPRVPDCVGRWLNFWDRDDMIAVRPHLEADLVLSSSRTRVESSRIDSDGLWVHTATKYLASPAVGGPVAEALASTANLTVP